MPPHEPDWDDEERELLGSATLDSPPPGSRARTLSALGVTGAVVGGAVVTGSAQAAGLASAAGSATTVVAASSGKSLVVGKWLMLLAAGGAAGGTALYYRAESAPAASAVATAQAPALEPAARPAPPTVEPPVSEATPVPTTPAPAKATPTQGASEPDIALEIELLDGARRASDRRDFATALSELDRYDREHKQGRLRQEALLLRVQTLIGKGDRAAARALGERFLSRYPKSPLAPRMQKLIGS